MDDNAINKLSVLAEQAAVNALQSPELDVALETKIPDNDTVAAKMVDIDIPYQYGGSRTLPDMPKPWEVRGKHGGTLQIYLPAGAGNSLNLDNNFVGAATSLSLVASAIPGEDGYYDTAISDDDGPLGLYRWLEPEPAAPAGYGWIQTGAVQWNMGTKLPMTGTQILIELIAVKTSHGIWISCAAEDSAYLVPVGDGDVTPGGPASITTIAPGLLQLVGWTGSAGSAVDLKGGTNSPVLYSKGANGVGQLVVLTDSSAGYEGASDSDSDSIGPQDITTGSPAGGTAWSQTADGPSASGKQLILKLSVLSYDTAYGSGWHRMDVTLTFHADGRLASCSGFSDGSNIQTVEPL